MNYTAPSTTRSRLGRSCPRQGMLDALDGAVVGGATRPDTESTTTTTADTRRYIDTTRGGPATRPGGWSMRAHARRLVQDLEGVLQELAHGTPSGEQSIWPSGPTSPERIGACRKATHESGRDASPSQSRFVCLNHGGPSRPSSSCRRSLASPHLALRARGLVNSARPPSGVRGRAAAWKAPWLHKGPSLPRRRPPPHTTQLAPQPTSPLGMPLTTPD